VEADVSSGSVKMLTLCCCLAASKLAPRHHIFAVLDFYEMDVPLIGHKLTRVRTLNKGWKAVDVAESPPSPPHPALLPKAYQV